MVRKKYSHRQILWLIAGIISIILLLSLYIWHLSESIRLGYEINQLEKQLETIKKEVALLEAEKTSLLNPEKVEKIAREKLNLHDPQPEQIIYLNQEHSEWNQ
jgi:cell division protein FtsL